jgi:hypothetical protein
MEKQEKRARKKPNARKPRAKKRRRPRVFKLTGRTMRGKPKPAETPEATTAPAPDTQTRLQRTCHTCMFSVSAAFVWMRTLFCGFPISAMCANQPDTPGLMRPVPHRPCRNYKMKRFRTDPPEPPHDGIRYIALTRGLHAMVDAADYEWLMQYKWSVQPSADNRTWYAKRTDRGRLVLMHRLIMKPPKGMVVDHINGNGLDNRRCNLRICTRMQNSFNRSKQRNARHRFIGVSPCGKSTYQVIVQHKGKVYREGPFHDELEAARARDRLARKLHGPYARLNDLPDDPAAPGP